MIVSRMLRALYDKTMRLAAHPKAVWWLAFISFLESSIFPIPPDVLLIPLILADRRRAFWYAGVCTVSSVVGGWVGYAIGYELFELVGQRVIDFYHLNDSFAAFRDTFNEYGLWIILGKGATPFPYKLITITAGLTHFDFATFTIASILTRGVRFYLLAVLLWYFGEPIRHFIERYLTWVTLGALVLIVGGFLLLKLL
jgi:membrane protein YqaA with SNARE-associated domain